MIFFSKSTVGRTRKTNQDVYKNLQTDKYIIMAVCDGMGGQKAGEVAAKITCEKCFDFFQKNYSEKKDIISFIKETIKYANTQVYNLSRQNEEYSNMGTTIVFLLYKNKNIYIANVGDSRAYILNRYGLSQVTKDHSYVSFLLEKGAITKEESKKMNNNVITRAIGIDKFVKADIVVLEDVKNAKILLCSDGLTNEVSDTEIEKIIKSEDNIRNAVEKLVETAEEHGGRDNITVSLFNIGGEV